MKWWAGGRFTKHTKSSMMSFTFWLEQGHLFGSWPLFKWFPKLSDHLLVYKLYLLGKETEFLWLLRGQLGQIDYSVIQASWEIIKSFECEFSWLPFPIFFFFSSCLFLEANHGFCPMSFPQVFLTFPPPDEGKGTIFLLIEEKVLRKITSKDS